MERVESRREGQAREYGTWSNNQQRRFQPRTYIEKDKDNRGKKESDSKEENKIEKKQEEENKERRH